MTKKDKYNQFENYIENKEKKWLIISLPLSIFISVLTIGIIIYYWNDRNKGGELLQIKNYKVIKKNVFNKIDKNINNKDEDKINNAINQISAPLAGIPIKLDKMAYIPAGYFIMGTDDPGRKHDEHPSHKVYLDEFYIDINEITNKEYKECIISGQCTESRFNDDPILGADNLPVSGVSWFDANIFCHWAGKSLPTEAQWEIAARGDSERRYPWGNELPDCLKANFVECNILRPGFIGKRPGGKSFYGLEDLAGNVWEWIADWYSPIYYQNSPEINPHGPESGRFRVLRGGSWKYGKNELVVTNRHRDEPEHSLETYGFRCVYQSPVVEESNSKVSLDGSVKYKEYRLFQSIDSGVQSYHTKEKSLFEDIQNYE